MATNVYDREVKIFFDPAKPAIRYGWYVSTSGDGMDIDGFQTLERKKAYLKKVADALAYLNDPELYPEDIAVLAFINQAGIGDDQEFAFDLIGNQLGAAKLKVVWDIVQPIAEAAAAHDEEVPDGQAEKA